MFVLSGNPILDRKGRASRDSDRNDPFLSILSRSNTRNLPPWFSFFDRRAKRGYAVGLRSSSHAGASMGALQVVTVLFRQIFQSRAELAAENLALRPQPTVYAGIVFVALTAGDARARVLPATRAPAVLGGFDPPRVRDLSPPDSADKRNPSSRGWGCQLAGASSKIHR
jgi:hypothetical protein